MGKIKNIFYSLIFILINLFLSIAIFFLINAFYFKKIAYIKYFQPLNIKVIKNYKTEPLLKNEIIEGEFIAENNFLGAIWIRFDQKEKIVDDKIVFRLKEKNKKNWLFENIYEAKLFTGLENYPFGIKPIINSKNKTYIFQLKSLKGSPENSVKLGKNEPLVTLQYQIPLKSIKKFEYLNLFILQFVILSFFSFLFMLTTYQLFFKKIKKINYLVIILFFGLFWRLLLVFSPITFDLRQFIKDVEIFINQENIYLKQNFYNYTPIYFFILGILELVNQKLFNFPHHFLIRFLLIFVDLIIFIILKKILTLKKRKKEWSGLFFLNPIVFLPSVHQGQFDNLSILFLLTAYLFFLKKKNYFLQFLFLTISLIIKHIILIPIIFAFFSFFNRKKAVFFIFLSILIFFFTFIPYLPNSYNQIVNNVFKYQANKTIYGWGYFINNLRNYYPFIENLKKYYILIFLLFAFLLAFLIKKSSSKKILVGFLYFLSFTPGVHSHYFSLPIVFSIFNLSVIFLIYNLSVFFYYLPFYVGYGYLAPITPQSLWIFSFTWFLVELIGYERIEKILRK